MQLPMIRLVAFCVAFSAFVCLADERHTKDSLDTVKMRLAEKKAVLVDVREQKEWDAGHLEKAKLVPLSKLRKETDLEKLAKALVKDLPKDKIIYTHCRSGVRCVAAADVLEKLGYDVRPLKSGYQDLLDAGFPKAKPKDE